MSKVAVIGAGPVGLCVALALLDAGHAVTVVAPSATGAGWAAGGMLSPSYEAMQDTRSATADPHWSFEYHQNSPVFYGDDFERHWLLAERDPALKAWAKLSGWIGGPPLQPVHGVAGTEADRLWLSMVQRHHHFTEPNWIAQGYQAVEIPGDLVLNPREWLPLMQAQVEALGGVFNQQAANTVQTGQIELQDCTVLSDLDAIVVASGYSPRPLLRELESLVPVSGQLIRVEGQHLSGAARHKSIYIVDRGDHTVIGATSRRGDASVHSPAADAQMLLAAGTRIVPSLNGHAITDTWAGVRPGTPDGKPMVGWSSVPGVLVANGTYRNGWLLAPLIGSLISKAIAGMAIEPMFDPCRFLDR